MKKIFLLITFMLILGCSSITKKYKTANLSDVYDNLSSETSVIQNSSEKIDLEATDIVIVAREIQDEGQQNGITKKANNIKIENKKIRNANQNLRLSSEKVLSAGEEINSYVKENNNLRKENKNKEEKINKLKTELDSALQKKIQWLIFYSIISLGVSIALIATGSKFGIFGAISSALILVIAQTVNSFSIYITIFGGILLFGIVIGVFWYIFVYKKAFKEVVNSMDVVKNFLPNSVKEIVFGKENDNGKMKEVQSPKTEQIVKKEKNKIKKQNQKKNNKRKKKSDIL